ncbi:hypothetical protein CALVIDRAFT_221667 [Calocera viscosa TUFC12733]|uniref:Uncharacterized protein n=1 Tax=Calocera viscosa (strain TUFC12733) TaxID=1330018 RepID=A0A167K670_CALVF|nr:hypothetical protein CALVIDRAFT_221667 [Calocera viscosa TUFC12733]
MTDAFCLQDNLLYMRCNILIPLSLGLSNNDRSACAYMRARRAPSVRPRVSKPTVLEEDAQRITLLPFPRAHALPTARQSRWHPAAKALIRAPRRERHVTLPDCVFVEVDAKLGHRHPRELHLHFRITLLACTYAAHATAEQGELGQLLPRLEAPVHIMVLVHARIPHAALGVLQRGQYAHEEHHQQHDALCETTGVSSLHIHFTKNGNRTHGAGARSGQRRTVPS